MRWVVTLVAGDGGAWSPWRWGRPSMVAVAVKIRPLVSVQFKHSTPKPNQPCETKQTTSTNVVQTLKPKGLTDHTGLRPYASAGMRLLKGLGENVDPGIQS